jgi:hypothetical protein
MRLESARGLKQQLLSTLIEPFAALFAKVRHRGATVVASAGKSLVDDRAVIAVSARPFETLPRLQRSIALGVARQANEYRLAVRVQRPSLLRSSLVEQLTRHARGEVDVRMVGRIDKRPTAVRRVPARRAVIPWYQANTRPLLIGASVGHVKVTAGTIGAFVKRGNRTYLLSNNHVLANEDLGRAGDWILQRAAYDGGKPPGERAARLRFWIRLKTNGANVVDAALAQLETAVAADVAQLRDIQQGADRKLRGVGPQFIDEGDRVFKVGRTTGPTEGRVTAFDVDNVIVNYDRGNLRFDNQIEIEGAGTRAFSDGGDSGSLIVNSDMQALALLFAGGDTGGTNGMGLTYANPIHRVLSDLKATLLF